MKIRQLFIAILMAVVPSMANAALATNDDVDVAALSRAIVSSDRAKELCNMMNKETTTGMQCTFDGMGRTLIIYIAQNTPGAAKAMCLVTQDKFTPMIKQMPGFMEAWRILFAHKGAILNNCPFNPNEG